MDKTSKIKRIIAAENQANGVYLSTGYYTNGIDFILYSRNLNALEEALKKYNLTKEAEHEKLEMYHEAHFKIKIR